MPVERTAQLNFHFSGHTLAFHPQVKMLVPPFTM